MSPTPPPRRPRWLAWLGGAALCLAVGYGYWPALHGGFIFDDAALLADNPMIRASDGLYRFWFTTEPHDYWPLTSTTFWLEWRLWGDQTTGYHVTNIVLHAAESLLLWAILLRLGLPGAYLAALLFAVHPVNVESVAWIAQRKNLVGMLFFLLATLFYLESDEGEGESSRGAGRPSANGWYWLSLATFLLALLGKGSVAILPLVLLLLAWWQRDEISRRDLLRVAPFAALAAIMVLVNVWFQTHGEGQVRSLGPGERILGAGAVVWFYLFKALWPLHLSFVYPSWEISAGDPLWWLPLLSALVVSGLLFHFCRRGTRPYLMAWAFFCVALVPVMGLTDVSFMRFSLVADHYQHIALIGVAALVAAGWSAWHRRAAGAPRVLSLAAAVAAVAVLLGLTVRQSALYADENRLYRATIATNPDAWLAHYNLAVNLHAEGRRAEELAHLREAVRAHPEYAEAQTRLAVALLDAGEPVEALPHAREAVRLAPEMPEALVHLGIALARAGRESDALEPLERAVRLQPESFEAHYNLALVLAALGRTEEAMGQYGQAEQIQPGSASPVALGKALVGAGRYEEAIPVLEQALGPGPEAAEARATLAWALNRAGRAREAVAQYEEILRIEPEGLYAAEAHYNLGVLLSARGQKGPAAEHYEQALQVRPDYAEAHYNLAVELLAAGRTGEALSHLEAAAQIKPDLLPARLVLADVLALTGRVGEAVAQARAVMPMTPPSTRGQLERKIRDWQSRAR